MGFFDCEWDPTRNEKRNAQEKSHAKATWIIGAKDKWHVCDNCALLKKFRKYRKRVKSLTYTPRLHTKKLIITLKGGGGGGCGPKKI